MNLYVWPTLAWECLYVRHDDTAARQNEISVGRWMSGVELHSPVPGGQARANLHGGFNWKMRQPGPRLSPGKAWKNFKRPLPWSGVAIRQNWAVLRPAELISRKICLRIFRQGVEVLKFKFLDFPRIYRNLSIGYEKNLSVCSCSFFRGWLKVNHPRIRGSSRWK